MELSDTADVLLYVVIAIVRHDRRRGVRAAGLARASGVSHPPCRAADLLRPRITCIWRDPGDVARADWSTDRGDATARRSAPFRFVEEHATGSQPCVSVRDGRGRRWRVKWGNEVRSENFAVRLAWACGYFAETTYFVESGTIARARRPAARARLHRRRLPVRGGAVRARRSRGHGSCSRSTAGRGTTTRLSARRELNGLKILVMLLSNWDTKDRRDVARGSNTAIFEHRVSPLAARGAVL